MEGRKTTKGRDSVTKEGTGVAKKINDEKEWQGKGKVTKGGEERMANKTKQE